jgi:hypothetical protein
MFSLAEFERIVPDKLRRHLTPVVHMDSVPEIIADAFRRACEVIAPVIKDPTLWEIHFFSEPPCRIEGAAGHFVFEPNTSVVNACVSNLIIINCGIIAGWDPRLCVASILEELVHVCLNIGDEHLARLIVCELHPEVIYENGAYKPKPPERRGSWEMSGL